MDQNGDGKLTKTELPDRAQPMFDRADTNRDGVLDESELERMAERFGGEGRPGAGGGRGRPERARRPPQQP